MSKINQIQNRLRELEGGAFQKLCDAYLHKKGYDRINSLGSVIGADKVRKGTPDTWVSLPTGKYVFAEYTTQQEEVYKKLKSDLDKCFDEAKTGVLVEKIEEVVFCHTSTLTPAEENGLAEECQKRRVNLNIFGIGSLSHDLYQKYPGLARDFLGIEVDTGQIVLPDEFISAYNKNTLVAPLDTGFHFREEEVGLILRGIEEGDLILVSGRAGVGKSRLALECCTRFTDSHPEYVVRCILNRGPDLFEDLRVHFSEPGHYLILVDDANRINRFEYVLQLLQDQSNEKRIKIIASVRDYALDKVREMARPYGGRTEVELQPLEKEQIKKLIEEEYGIRHHLYLERIADIAKGNPRLAIMAALLAKQKSTLDSINNVTTLYDEYYLSIRQDLEDLDNPDLLKAAGIVAFFRVVDQTNAEIMGAIKEAFGIYPEAFWEAVQRLHEMEALDMYEDEVVRASDQVLATYLFYLAFFRKQVLDFSVLLTCFFPHFRHRLVDAINPVLSAFDSKAIMDAMQPHVDKAWEVLEKRESEEDLLPLMELFWFLKETDTLLYTQGQIAKMEQEPVDISELNFKPRSDILPPSLLGVLGSFRDSDESTRRIALGLLLDYAAKRPSSMPQVLNLLIDRLGFKHTSHMYGFAVERAVIDVLWERAWQGEDELFSKLFLAVAEPCLHTRIDTSKWEGREAITFISFELPPTPQLFELRRTIWSRVFSLYGVPSLREEVLALLRKHSKSFHSITVPEILAQDAPEVIRFIEMELDPNCYRHCLVVQDYLDLLEARDVPFDEKLRNRFRNEIYVLSELLLDDRTERKNLHLGHEEYTEFKEKQIRSHFNSYGFSDYKRFFEQCFELMFQSRVVDVLLALADRDLNLYSEVLQYYVGLGDPLKLDPFPLIYRFIQVCVADRACEILMRQDYPSKQRWLFGFYRSIQPGEITAERLDQLYTLYRVAKREDLPNDVDFLLKYRQLDGQVVARVTEIILKRAKDDPAYAHPLPMLFNPYRKANKELVDLFAGEFELLKQAYYAALEVDRHGDYDGRTFALILDMDINFIYEYIDWMYERENRLICYNDTRDYSFLWMRENYKELMTRVIEHIYQKERGWAMFSLEPLFHPGESGNDNCPIRERQDQVLRSLIDCRCSDPEFMQFLFSMITRFPPERRRPLIVRFLERNQRFEDFEKLPLEPNSWGLSGSAVPMLEERVEYLESLLPLLNTVDYLQHKQYVERRIRWLRDEIEYEKKRDFMKD